MDEEQVQDQALNQDVQADVTESPSVEAEAAPAEAPQVQEELKAEPKPRNNASSRIRELVDEKKQLAAERDNYAQLLQQAQNMQIPDNISEDQLRALQVDAGYATAKVQELERKLAFQEFTKEVDSVEQQYSELNPESEDYNEPLAKALSEAYEEGFVVKDQNGRFVGTKKSLKDFTSQMLEAYRTAATKEVARTKAAIDRQVAEAAVTPQSTNQSNEAKPFESLSIKEMEERLGIVHN